MDDFFSSAFGNSTILMFLLILAAILLVFAFIGANHVIREFLGSGSNSDTNSSNQRRRRRRPSDENGDYGVRCGSKLQALILGGLAFAGPLLYDQVVSRPDFVDNLDFVLDEFQAKLREVVVSTASVQDDAVLDTIDSVLDGFQETLRAEVLKRTTLRAESSGGRRSATRPPRRDQTP